MSIDCLVGRVGGYGQECIWRRRYYPVEPAYGRDIQKIKNRKLMRM